MGLLVTGGSGYLGREILRRRPDSVGTVHRADGEVRLDVRDAVAVAGLIAQPDLSADPHRDCPRGAGSWATNVDGARNVAVAAASADARLIHVSTDVVFGATPAGRTSRPIRWIRSPTTGAPGRGRGGRAGGAPGRGGRPDVPDLRRRAASGHERLALAALDGGTDMAFFTDELRCPVTVGDLAEALLELADHEHSGPLHVAGSDPVSRYELARLVAAANGRDPAPVRGARSADIGSRRPLDCRLDCGLARSFLATPLRGVHEVLQGPSRSTAQPPSALV
jgi:dTDP-4-dehydrorhamnose reductase